MAELVYRKRTTFRNRITSFVRSRRGTAALAVLISFVLIGFFIPYDPMKTMTGGILQAPSNAHLFGTDHVGRDIFSQVFSGVRVTIAIGVITALITVLLGVVIGCLAGYYGGILDHGLMRVTEVVLVMPRIFFALVIVALFGSSLVNIIFSIAILSWPTTARLIRAEFLSLRQRPFVEAARSLGANDRYIVFREILPNALTPVIINVSIEAARAILTEAGLGFFGLSDPSIISLGSILNFAQRYVFSAWWMAVFPGIALCLVVLAFDLMGDQMNAILRPKTRVRE